MLRGAQVFNHHIRLPDELKEEIPSCRSLQVQGDTPLVAVELVKQGGAERRTLRFLDQDDVGSEIPQISSTQRAGPVVRQLEHPQPGQRTVNASSRRKLRQVPFSATGVIPERGAGDAHRRVRTGRLPEAALVQMPVLEQGVEAHAMA